MRGKLKRAAGAAKQGLVAALIGIIRVYQWTLGPLLPMTCRFEPSCSRYAVEALRRYGPWRGLWLAASRILRCNPFHAGGYDPVP